MTKVVTSCDWVPSIVTEAMLQEYVKIGFLPAKDVVHWRAPNPDEVIPQPQDDEVIVFTDHMNQGFSPPGSKFFCDVLHFSNFILKTLDPILCQIFAISKCSAKCIFKRNLALNSLESTFT